ncbi:hypothetical protein [Curtanaerobium respiraculi]|uniref:hypothetical protein n=1 Tax=Curtanaerobium respiraculi TaxID=2949669 RepID=UPI0024B34C82|nr:hypothetical protein [Curtanaerobium respiraculi]
MLSKPNISAKDIFMFLDISSTSIRMYEKYLEKPPYEVLDSGYRQYDASSLFHLFELRSFSKSGMSVQNSTKDITAASLEDKYASLNKCRTAVCDEIQRNQAVLDGLNDKRALLSKISTLYNSFDYEVIPGFWFLECEENGQILKDPDDRKVIQNWASQIPLVYLINHLRMEDVRENKWSYRLGLGISDKASSYVNLANKHIRHVPAQLCLAMIVKDVHSKSLRAFGYDILDAHVRTGLDYLAQENLTLKGDVFSRLVAINLDEQGDKRTGESETGDFYFITYPI